MGWEDRVWRITTDELLERYKAGERNFNGIELIRVVGEMGERDGIDGNITGLEGADLRDISLRGANLEQVDLSGADLTGADLFGAYLRYACLYRTILYGANLQGANLNWAACHETIFSNANLTGVTACSTGFIRASVSLFEDSVLANASFENANVYPQMICRAGNLIWGTTMPDGSMVRHPQWGDGRGN
jgi:uncharacterized protein YjbI with pentapeptide repeats